jgi:membrane protein DedA with SNARE-associated domain
MLLPLATILGWVGDKMSSAGYPVLFGLLLSCGLGVPIPEDIPLLLAGYFVADGRMNLAAAAICAWCGIIGGDCILYLLGRYFGTAITKVPVIGSHINKDRIEWTHQQFEKHGVWVVAVGRLFAGIRGVMVLTAGTIRFTFWHFIIADGLAAIVSGGLFMWLGYWARTHFGDLDQIDADIKKYQGMVLAVVVTAVLVFAIYKWVQRKKHRRRVDALKQKARHREAASTTNKNEG